MVFDAPIVPSALEGARGELGSRRGSVRRSLPFSWLFLVTGHLEAMVCDVVGPPPSCSELFPPLLS